MVFSPLARRILKKKKTKEKKNRLHRIISTPIHEYSWHCLIMQLTLALQTLCNCASTVVSKTYTSSYALDMRGNTGLSPLHHKLLYETCKFFFQILVLKPAKI